jgi:outer membrane protein TolC
VPTVVASVAFSVLAACSTYQPLQLPTTNDLLTEVSHTKEAVDAMPSRPLQSHVFDPSDGFDRIEFATLAVLNNPDLKLARADTGVTHAQAFAAGLLPDPQIALQRDHQLGYPPGATIAFTAGMTIDFAALLSHPALSAAADADARKAELNLLWQEWQTVAQAEVLFAKVVAQEKTLASLRRYQSLFADRWTRTKAAAERGLLSSDSVTPYLTALQDVNRQVSDLERQNNQSRHDLNALAGVDPGVTLALVAQDNDVHVDADAVHAALPEVLPRRPDLAALAAGYEAEDDRYRGALIAQFPGFTFGPDRARDTTNVNTTGFALGVTLPVFNRNRGNIAIERATREKLRIEFQGRLNATTVEVDRLLAEQSLLEAQLRQIDAALSDLDRATKRAESAFIARNVDALVLTNVQSSLLAKQVEQINTEEALTEQRVALRTLIGAGGIHSTADH